MGGPHSSVRLEVLVPKMGAFLTGESKDPLNYKLQLPLGHFGLCVARNPQARVTLLSGAVDPDQQEEAGLLFHDGRGEECAWSLGDPLGASW